MSPALADWKKEIEITGKGRVILARIYTDREQNRIILPTDTEERDILKRYFLNPSFVRLFVDMHGANLNYIGLEGTFQFVLLNMARAAEWGDQEDAVLGHELGHVWLHATGYPVPVYEGKGDSCLSIQAGDAVQHVVIRDELKRRGIPYSPYWTSNLEKLVAALENQPPRPATEIPTCQAASQIVLWLDARLGLSADDWGGFDNFVATMNRSFPDLEPQVDRLYELIHGKDLRDRDTHFQVLQQVLVAMYRFANEREKREEPPPIEDEPLD